MSSSYRQSAGATIFKISGRTLTDDVTAREIKTSIKKAQENRMKITIGQLRKIIREVVEGEQMKLELGPEGYPKEQRWAVAPTPPPGFELETKVGGGGSRIGSMGRYGDFHDSSAHVAVNRKTGERVNYNAKTREWEAAPVAKGGRYSGPQFGDNRSLPHIGVNPEDFYGRKY